MSDFFDDPKVSKALSGYLSILKKESLPRFKRVNLDPKVVSSLKVLESCNLCERGCKVDRYSKVGVCGAGSKMEISSSFVHLGEEYFLVPSFTVFFLGCNFGCEFCQNWSISQRLEKGVVLGPKQLASVIDAHSSCLNVNFVGGEPTPYLPFILQTLEFVKARIPVVWNSNFYMSQASMGLLRDVVDVYLSDFKYGNDVCAKRLSNVDNYMDVVKRNHLLAFDDSELVIRHLILPNHFDCCTKGVLDFIAHNFGGKVIVNLMDQYRPEFNASLHHDINRPISSKEFKKVINYADKLNINYIT